MRLTLLVIFAALALMIGSFIWFVATWDRDAEDPISHSGETPSFILAEKRPPEATKFWNFVNPLAAGAYLTHEGTT